MQNWSAEISPLRPPYKGINIALRSGDQPLRFAEMIELLRTDRSFGDWYSSILRQPDFPAFFWEHPPLTLARLVEPAEFVLLTAPVLQSLRPDQAAFSEHFNAARSGGSESAVTGFRNIGGDALLIVPCPKGEPEQYTHLGAFIRRAPATQIEEFWRATAEAVTENLGERPMWLSTSGLGVAWLHVRLDSRPKYYQYRPYTET